MSAHNEIIDYLSTKYPVVTRDRKKVVIVEKPSQRMDLIKDINMIMSMKYGKPAKRYILVENSEEERYCTGAGYVDVYWTSTKNHYVIYDYPDSRRAKVPKFIEGKL